MFLTILSSAHLETLNSIGASNSALLGYGLLVSIVVLLGLSSQRWLLWYLCGGIAYWLAVEMINSVLLSWSTLSDWHSYVAAMGISWLPLFGWVLYRALKYDDVSHALQQERDIEAARYIEHTPIYDDDYQPRFE